MTYNYHYFGYIPSLATPHADYRDFEHVEMDGLSLEASLRLGNLPPGLLLAQGKRVYQVWGEYGASQQLRVQGRRL
jgi:hypothetical protein